VDKVGADVEVSVMLVSEQVAVLYVEVLICPEKMLDDLLAAVAKTMVL
jgi:hypothetical protein